MILFRNVIFFILIVNIWSHKRNCNVRASEIRLSGTKSNSSNCLLPRKALYGYGYNGFKSFLGTVVRYMKSGFTFLSDKIGKAVLGTMESKNPLVNYKGYQVLRIDAIHENQVEYLKKLPDEIEKTEFWTPPMDNYYTDLLVSPESMDDVKEYLKEKKIDYEILIRDLQKVMTFENPKMTKQQRELLIGKRGHPMTWMRYHRFSDMLRYMEFLAFTYPRQVQLLTIGYSEEGLPLKVLKIFSKNSEEKDNDSKPAFWIDGGMHGREWITSSVVLYIVKQLVENYSKYREITDSATWYFLPVANPDGYEYSHSTDRLWKKNRSKHDVQNYNFVEQFLFGSCEGVDLNRNFDFHWGEKDMSKDPCRENYGGPRPFSEPETRAISDFVVNVKENLKLFITLHSYSQKWLIPWSYTTKKSPDYKELEKMAKKAAEVIALVTGSHYDVGLSSTLTRPISGTSADWAKGSAGIKYSYSIRLRDRGSFGFLLPAAQIVPTAKEIFVAVKILAKMITSKSVVSII